MREELYNETHKKRIDALDRKLFGGADANYGNGRLDTADMRELTTNPLYPPAKNPSPEMLLGGPTAAAAFNEATKRFPSAAPYAAPARVFQRPPRSPTPWMERLRRKLPWNREQYSY